MQQLDKELFLEPYNQFSEHDEKTLTKLANGIEGTFCEVGCWTGHSTSILARKNKVIVVDSFKGNEFTPLFSYAIRNNVKDIFISNMSTLGLMGNITLFDMESNKAHEFIDNNSISLLFIDAGHTYKDVKSDLINYIPKVINGGIICGHDYESDTYEEQYIDEDYVNGKHHGVIKAVNEVFGKVNHEGRMWWTKK